MGKKKKYHRVLTFIMTIVMTIGLVSCGKTASSDSSVGATQKSQLGETAIKETSAYEPSDKTADEDSDSGLDILSFRNSEYRYFIVDDMSAEDIADMVILMGDRAWEYNNKPASALKDYINEFVRYDGDDYFTHRGDDYEANFRFIRPNGDYSYVDSILIDYISGSEESIWFPTADNSEMETRIKICFELQGQELAKEVSECLVRKIKERYPVIESDDYWRINIGDEDRTVPYHYEEMGMWHGNLAVKNGTFATEEDVANDDYDIRVMYNLIDISNRFYINSGSSVLWVRMAVCPQNVIIIP